MAETFTSDDGVFEFKSANGNKPIIRWVKADGRKVGLTAPDNFLNQNGVDQGNRDYALPGWADIGENWRIGPELDKLVGRTPVYWEQIFAWDTPGTYTLTLPPDLGKIYFKMQGADSGGAAGNSGGAGPGGAEGGYAEGIIAIPGPTDATHPCVLTIVIGDGGNGGQNPGDAGLAGQETYIQGHGSISVPNDIARITCQGGKQASGIAANCTYIGAEGGDAVQASGFGWGVIKKKGRCGHPGILAGGNGPFGGMSGSGARGGVPNVSNGDGEVGGGGGAGATGKGGKGRPGRVILYM